LAKRNDSASSRLIGALIFSRLSSVALRA